MSKFEGVYDPKKVVLRLGTCSQCENTGVIWNDAGVMKPGHGWTGPVKTYADDNDAEPGAPRCVVVNPGEAVECKTCSLFGECDGNHAQGRCPKSECIRRDTTIAPSEDQT